jgi:protein-tyrosine phosphatase
MHRVILADKDATVRAPMAGAILREEGWDDEKTELLVRGYVVLFPEPVSQKADAVLVANGIDVSDYRSVQLKSTDADEDTLVVILQEKDRKAVTDILGEECADRIHVMTELCGEELEIMDPYGGPVGSYGICFETMSRTLKKFMNLLRDGKIDVNGRVYESPEEETAQE